MEIISTIRGWIEEAINPWYILVLVVFAALTFFSDAARDRFQEVEEVVTPAIEKVIVLPGKLNAAQVIDRPVDGHSTKSPVLLI